MTVRQSVRTWSGRVDDWLYAHPIAYFALLVGLAVVIYVALELVVGGDLIEAALRGLAFGVVFAGITVYMRRRRATASGR